MSNFPPHHQYQQRNGQHQTAREFRADLATLARQAKLLAGWVRSARFFVAFTGAGVSTAAGLPDYRGAGGTLTMRARGSPEPLYRSPLSMRPTLTHMALVGLERAGLLKRLVSQNTDGLHRRSWFPPESLAELHGNTAVERCSGCGAEYARDFRVRDGLPSERRETGRACGACHGAPALRHSLVLFGDPLRPQVLDLAREWCRRADLCLVLGSSLTVNPAARLPLECVDNGGRLAVCNLQPTPRDARCSMRLFAETDALMSLLMRELLLDIPAWSQVRRLRLEWRLDEQRTIRLEPLDALGNQLSHLSAVAIVEKSDADGVRTSDLLSFEPFDVPLRPGCPEVVEVELRFFGHFAEPPLRLRLDAGGGAGVSSCELQLSLLDADGRSSSKAWRVAPVGDSRSAAVVTAEEQADDGSAVVVVKFPELS